jgi:SAM-dependent methyltransferase
MAYRFDHQWKQERARLAALEAVFDPYSRRAILATEPEQGWHCLEVGAGGGSVAEWLCSVVGVDGAVVATDLETKFVAAIDAPNLEVRKHDIIRDPLEEDAFDLVHTRAVLSHLPEREEVLHRLVDALRPGAWLVLVGADLTAVRAIGLPDDEATFFEARFAAMVDVNRSIGMDPTYGRRLGPALRGAGLAEVVIEGQVIEWSSEHPLARLYTLTFQRLKALALEAGAVTLEEHDRLLSMMADAEFVGLSHTIFTARGQKVRV